MATASEVKERFADLVDYYFRKLEDCKDLKEVYELNWYCNQRMVEMSYGVFNETWGKGWDAVTTPKDTD